MEAPLVKKKTKKHGGCRLLGPGGGGGQIKPDFGPANRIYAEPIIPPTRKKCQTQIRQII